VKKFQMTLETKNTSSMLVPYGMLDELNIENEAYIKVEYTEESGGGRSNYNVASVIIEGNRGAVVVTTKNPEHLVEIREFNRILLEEMGITLTVVML